RLLWGPVPGAADASYVALTGLDESRFMLSVNGVSVTIDGDALQSIWTGQAHVPWRDFDGLGPPLHPGTRGVALVQPPQLLRRLGVARVKPPGTVFAGTAGAVVAFQRSHRLDADGLVGPLTRIVLYAAGPDYRRPRLAMSAETAS